MESFCSPAFLLLLLLNCPLATEVFSKDEALIWEGPQQPERNSFDFSGEKITVITGDAVIITKARLHQKNQVFIRDYIVDLTSPARSGWNLGQQAKRYEGLKFSNHEGFISHQHYEFEYKMHGSLSHDQCLTLCLLEKSTLPSTEKQIMELSSLYTSLKDFFWIKVDQHMSKDQYSLDFFHKQVFPENLWSNGSLHLFHYHNDRYQLISKEKLHGITSYYNFESGTYYNRQFHRLVARMNVVKDFEILVPLAKTAHVDEFSKGVCLCTRDLSLNLKNTYEAQSFARRARYRTVRSPRLLETQRVKRVSEDPLSSNVLSILSEPKFYFSPSFTCISPWDLHHLRIEDHRNASLRYKRALPLAAKLSLMMATKLAQFSLPYAFQHQENFLKKLKNEVKGKFLSVPQVSNVSFQSYLNDKFGSGSTSVDFLEDRINVSYEEPTMALSSMAPPSLSHAKDLESISHDLSYIEREILPHISPALLQKLLVDLPYQLNAGSPILLKTTTAGTFQRHRFWLELFRSDLSFTSFQARSLPFKAVDGIFTTYQVPNNTVLDIGKNENKPLMEKSCLTHLLADSDVITADFCPVMEYQTKTSEHMFTLAEGNVYSLHGPAVLHLDCFNHVTTAVKLQYEFTVVYISASCSASLDERHKTKVVSATEAVFHNHPYQVLVQINVPKLASTFDKIYFWLILLSSASIGSIICFLVVYGFFYYVKIRFRPRLSVNNDGMIDISVKHVQRPCASVLSSNLTVNNGMAEGTALREDASRRNQPSLLGPNQHIMEAVQYVADSENISMSLDNNDLSVRRQKPASH